MRDWELTVSSLSIGIIFASIFFVYQSSRRKAIRAGEPRLRLSFFSAVSPCASILSVFSGSDARSTVRRPQSQRAFIKDVGQQTQVMCVHFCSSFP